MNAVLELESRKIRPLVHEKVDRLTNEELAEVHRQLVVMEAKRELDRLRAEVSADWDAGRITEAKIADTIRDYRAANPYRTPVRP